MPYHSFALLIISLMTTTFNC